MGSFGMLVKQLRKERGYVLEHVAKKIGSHKGYLSGIENGKVKPPSARFIRKLSKILDYDEREMLKMACLEKVPVLIREEFEEALQMYTRHGGKGDTDMVPSTRLLLLNGKDGKYPTQLDKEGNPISLTNSHALVPKQVTSARYAIFVGDDEMKGKKPNSFSPGDILFLSTTASFKNKDVVFVIYTDHDKPVAKIREISFKPGGKVVLRPWNRKHREEIVNWDDIDLLMKVIRHCYDLTGEPSKPQSTTS